MAKVSIKKEYPSTRQIILVNNIIDDDSVEIEEDKYFYCKYCGVFEVGYCKCDDPLYQYQ